MKAAVQIGTHNVVYTKMKLRNYKGADYLHSWIDWKKKLCKENIFLKTSKFLYECLKSDEKMTFSTGLTCPRFIWFFNEVKSIFEKLYKKLTLDDHMLLVLMKLKATEQWSNGLVVKAAGSQSKRPVFKATVWLQGWLSLSSFRGRSNEYQEFLGTCSKK